MKIFTKMTYVVLFGMSSNSFAAPLFDNLGSSLSTAVAPKGHLIWEQGLPTAHYFEAQNAIGETQWNTLLQADTLLRLGVANNVEVRLDWDGPQWLRSQGKTKNALGDLSAGVKVAVPLDNERLSLAVLGEVKFATGNTPIENRNKDEIYRLASALSYAYDDLVTTGLTMKYALQGSRLSVEAVPVVQYKLSENWLGYSDFFYFKEEGFDTQSKVGSGVAYTFNNKRTQLNLGVSVDLGGENKGYNADFGIAHLF